MLRIGTLLFAATVSVPALADNFVNNPGFDVDLDHWFTPVAVWSPEDEQGDPASGSARVEVEGHTGASLVSDCFPVGPGQALVYGAAANLEGAPLHSARVGAVLRFYAAPGCAGTPEWAPYPNLHVLAAHSGWGATQNNLTAPASAQSAELVIFLNVDGDEPQTFFVDNAFVSGGSCASAGRVLCLGKDRFRVTATFRTAAGARGQAGARPLGGDSGYLWFFDPGNLELVLKALDGCGSNDRFWVYAAGLTNLAVELRIVDTWTGESWSHDNPLDVAFPPRQDIEAFATCDAAQPGT